MVSLFSDNVYLSLLISFRTLKTPVGIPYFIKLVFHYGGISLR